MSDPHPLHDGWLLTAIGMAALAVFVYQLRTGKVAMKGLLVPIRVFHRDRSPWIYWPWVTLTCAFGLLILGYGIFKVAHGL